MIITMGFLPGRIWPLLTQNPLVAKISPRLDQEAKCPAGGGDIGCDDDGYYGDGGGGDGGYGELVIVVTMVMQTIPQNWILKQSATV